MAPSLVGLLVEKKASRMAVTTVDSSVEHWVDH